MNNIFYLKDADTFLTLKHIAADKYTKLPIASAEVNTGDVLLTELLEGDYENAWLLDSAAHLYLIIESSPNDQQTKFKVTDPAEAFDREIIYTGTEPTTYGAFIAQILTEHYINCPDTAYAMPFVTVSNTDTTPFLMPELNEGRYKLNEIIRLARLAGVKVDFSVIGAYSETMKITISPPDGTVQNIFFSDGKHQINNETYTRDVTAKVTVSIKTETQSGDDDPVVSYEYMDFYLDTAGNISSTVPASRAAGRWLYTDIGHEDGTGKDAENALLAAEEVFQENINSHNISFYSRNNYALGTAVNMRIYNRVYKTTITRVSISSTDERKLYQCGDLPVKLTEAVERIKKAVKNK